MYDLPFSMHDNMLLPVTYDDVSLMARNLNPERRVSLRDEVKKVLMERVEDALYEFDTHIDEILADAFPDDGKKELVLADGWTQEAAEELAWEIHRFLRRHYMWIDVSIYYNDKRMTTCRKIENGRHEFRYNEEPFIEEGLDPRDYFEYVANPHVLSMSFEGPLCELLAYGIGGEELYKQFYSIFDRHGLRFELGDHWNGSAYVN